MNAPHTLRAGIRRFFFAPLASAAALLLFALDACTRFEVD